jgi:hypothetical protein
MQLGYFGFWILLGVEFYFASLQKKKRKRKRKLDYHEETTQCWSTLSKLF